MDINSEKDRISCRRTGFSGGYDRAGISEIYGGNERDEERKPYERPDGTV